MVWVFTPTFLALIIQTSPSDLSSSVEVERYVRSWELKIWLSGLGPVPVYSRWFECYKEVVKSGVPTHTPQAQSGFDLVLSF